MQAKNISEPAQIEKIHYTVYDIFVRRGSCLDRLKMSSKPNHRRLLGGKIRSFRKQIGLTQKLLAEKTGLHQNFIGAVERGDMETSLTSLLKIAKALKVAVRDLVEDF